MLKRIRRRKVVKALTEARTVLFTDGWTKNDFQNAHGQHCAVGAVAAVTLPPSTKSVYGNADHPKLEAAVSALYAQLSRDRQYPSADVSPFGRIDAVTHFNDDEVTGFADVVALFDRAIENA